MDKAEYVFTKIAKFSPETVSRVIAERLKRIKNLQNSEAGDALIMRTLAQSENIPQLNAGLIRSYADLASNGNPVGLYDKILKEEGYSNIRKLVGAPKIPLNANEFTRVNLGNSEPAFSNAPVIDKAEELISKMKSEAAEYENASLRVNSQPNVVLDSGEVIQSHIDPNAITDKVLRDNIPVAAAVQQATNNPVSRSGYGRYIAGMGVLGAGVGGTMVYKQNKKEKI